MTSSDLIVGYAQPDLPYAPTLWVTFYGSWIV